MFKKFFLLFLLPFFILLSVASEKNGPEKSKALYRARQKHWVDSVYNQLSGDERIGQLFMVAAWSDAKEVRQQEMEELIARYHVGGLIFFQGGPGRQAALTNRYQRLARVPLLIGMDAEWGLGMRLDSTISFPRQMTLGAIANNEYVYRMGTEVARQSVRLGVHLNFAPVVDINSNPTSPVMGSRSFGEDKENVALKGVAYMRGMQDKGLIASARHFPGHGDSGPDSHNTLPVTGHNKNRLRENELYPFRKLFADSLQSVMVAHLGIPAYEKNRNLPASLSASVVTDLLQKEMGFAGLVFTDNLNMKAVTKNYKPGEIEVLALQAGNDVLLFPEDVPEAVNRIKKALKGKQLNQADLEHKVRKILAAKYKAGLNTPRPVELTGLADDLNNAKAKTLNYELYEQAITLVANEGKLVPFLHLDTLSFASVSIGLSEGNLFQETLSKYAAFQHFVIADKDTSEAAYSSLVNKLKNYKVVVVSLHGMSDNPAKAYGVRASTRNFIERLRTRTSVVLTVFGSPYSLKYFDQLGNLICAYEDNPVTQRLVPQALFGALAVNGKLPVTASPRLKAGTGYPTTSLRRLAYSVPERVGLNSTTLTAIDKMVENCIKDHVMPGCQILVARNGTVVYEKAYGYMTYDTVEPVTPHTLYDIASVTKVAATLQAIMFLHERGVLDLNKKASEYLTELKGTNKENMLVRDILMHQAGLIAFQDHWTKTRTKAGPSPAYYSRTPDEQHQLEVAPGLYGVTSLRDSLWNWTIQSRLLRKPARQEKHNFEYSDLSFYMLKQLAERLLNQPIEQFLTQNFYEPLGLDELTFNPLCRFGENCIAPTEKDNYFRNVLVRGTVHDQGAALQGGVAGHAGLFGTANDLAVLMQMNLQKGYYGGRRYFQETTLPVFVKSYNKGNRRGLGWDRPRPEGGGHVSDFASRNCFGHTGFTGTCVWVDPDENIVYVFLSNRVYPSAGNTKLADYQVRRKIQDVVYKSIINFQAINASIKQ